MGADDDVTNTANDSQAAARTPTQTPAVRKLSAAVLSAFTSRGGLDLATPAPHETPRRSVFTAQNARFAETLNGVLSAQRQKIHGATVDPVCKTLFPGGAKTSNKGMIYSFGCFQMTFFVQFL